MIISYSRLLFLSIILFVNDKGGEIIAYQLVIVTGGEIIAYQLVIVTGGANRYILLTIE